MSRRRAIECAWVVLAVGTACVVGATQVTTQAPTTLNDFFMFGTQPETLVDKLGQANNQCIFCHGGYDESQEPHSRWAASMMGQAARDPIFYACLTIANQDAAFAGDLCLRCHTPMGWMVGHSVPTDGSALEEVTGDFEGVSCSICHRMVDPVYSKENPMADIDILNDLAMPGGGGVPVNPHTANIVLDPEDRRRGPYELEQFYHAWLESPFHRDSALCAHCHDVSNPVYERQEDDTYLLGELDAPHPTQDKYDQFPLERTYSEWLNSSFAQGPIEMGGRFGGNRTAVSSCQDCHMPTTTGQGCDPGFGSPVRDDLAQHNFNGANTWVLRAINATFPQEETLLTDELVEDAVARAEYMLRAASDMELSVIDGQLNVRITNMTGHKLPTGYPEGRRMWINVKYFNGADELIEERGAYDPETADLDTESTKVYEGKLGVDENVAGLYDLPVGPSFHFVLNNKWFKDNRIPPIGFTNAAFAAAQAAPVGYTYADGQYWDDTLFDIPEGAARADVQVLHQLTTKEYIEFLRDENETDNTGQHAYDLWVQFGKSPPTVMDDGQIELGGGCDADWDGNGVVNAADVGAFLTDYFLDLANGTIVTDFDGNGVVNAADVGAFITRYFLEVGGPC